MLFLTRGAVVIDSWCRPSTETTGMSRANHCLRVRVRVRRFLLFAGIMK